MKRIFGYFVLFFLLNLARAVSGHFSTGEFSN